MTKTRSPSSMFDVQCSTFDDFSSDSIGTGEETDFEFEFDGRKETRSPRTIFQQFIGNSKSQSNGQNI